MINYEELYIDGQEVDIKDVAIEEDYKTPFFSDVSEVFSDTTKTITLPQTERNKAVMQHLQAPDMNTDFPYKYHYADYYRNGVHRINHGRVNVVSDWEIQIVYGVNREKYLPMKQIKMNELQLNSNATSDEWIVKWNKINMYSKPSTAKYEYLNYVSGKRTSDVQTIDGIVQPTTIAPEPFLSNEKEMTMHPFISAENIINLIFKYIGISGLDLASWLTKLTNKGIILAKNESDQTTTSASYVPSSYPFSIYNSAYTGDYPNTAGYYIPLVFTDSKNYIQSVDSATRVFWVDKYSQGLDGSRLKITGSISIQSSLDNLLSHIYLVRTNGTTETLESIAYTVTQFDTDSDDETDLIRYDFTRELEYTAANVGEYYRLKIVPTNNFSVNTAICTNLSVDIKIDSLKTAIYGVTKDSLKPIEGYYNCLINFPTLTMAEMLQQFLIHTCSFLGYDSNGDIKIYHLDEFVSNYQSGNVVTWDGKVTKEQKSYFQFNSNAQQNWIKYSNDKDLIKAGVNIPVSDVTLEATKDLHVLSFEQPLLSLKGISEYVLYEQTVKNNDTSISFENKYTGGHEAAFVKKVGSDAVNTSIVGESSQTFLNLDGGIGDTAYAFFCNGFTSESPLSTWVSVGQYLYSAGGNVLSDVIRISAIDDTTSTLTFDTEVPNDPQEIVISNQLFSYGYYTDYQKLINRPIVKEISIFLNSEESSNPDFTKPIYIKEWGKYCMLLSLTVPNKGLCTAKLLLINQTL